MNQAQHESYRIIDGARYSKEEIEYALATLNPKDDPTTWNIYYKNWEAMDNETRRN